MQTPNSQAQVNQNVDAVSYAESMLKRSGGDAKAAFYLAAEEKGINPDDFLNRLNSFGDMKTMAQNVLATNPRAKQFMSLFSMVK